MLTPARSKMHLEDDRGFLFLQLQKLFMKKYILLFALTLVAFE
jgi:hypothetical protein